MYLFFKVEFSSWIFRAVNLAACLPNHGRQWRTRKFVPTETPLMDVITMPFFADHFYWGRNLQPLKFDGINIQPFIGTEKKENLKQMRQIEMKSCWLIQKLAGVNKKFHVVFHYCICDKYILNTHTHTTWRGMVITLICEKVIGVEGWKRRSSGCEL